MKSTGGYQDIPTATAVTSSSYGQQPNYNTIDNTTTNNNSKNKKEGDESWEKGQVQPPAYRDVGFGIAFWAQLVTTMILAVLFARGVIETEPFDIDDDNDDKSWVRRLSLISTRRRLSHPTTTHHTSTTSTFAEPDPTLDVDPTPILWTLALSLIMAPLITVLFFRLLYRNAQWLIQTSVVLAIGINLFLALVCLVTGIVAASLGPLMLAVFTVCYAKAIWNRIPYAAANLKTAVASIQSQLGVAFLGLTAIPIYLVYWILWIYVFVMTMNTSFMKSQVQSTQYVNSGPYSDDAYTMDEEYTSTWWTIVILFLFTFFWTNQVIGNSIQATVAGSVGTFWFVPEEAVGCCSSGLTSSLARSLTYSFGSICFGSLIVAIIQTLKALVQNARDSSRRNGNGNGGGALLLCLTHCLLDLLERAAEYFNKWAFIYVGLYGYPYIEAGKSVVSLFRHRGWTAVISDNLTSRVLGMMSFAVGLVMACIGALVAILLSSSSSGDTIIAVVISSLMALIIGSAMASIIFGVVSGAVDTVIVLFAEAPEDFQALHPVLSMEMNDAWREAWPDMFTPSIPAVVV